MISKRILFARTLARLGPRDLRLAARHRLRLRSRYYEKRFPVADWQTEDVKFISPFVGETDNPTWRRGGFVRRLTNLEEATSQDCHTCLCFSWDERPLPENWHQHPLTGHEYPKRHWSRTPMFAGGDIKWMWEPSRMDWVVAACRAGIPDVPALMSEIRRWRDQNRPNEGVNWACGQETTFRMFALMLAATVLQDKNREAAGEVRAMLPQHAERIESAIAYAISQHNNHGLSETVGLFLAGHALPDHPRAKTWRQEGKSWFIQQVAEQFTDDGWYAQHSHNYTRVALLDGLMAMRVAEVFQDPLPKTVVKMFAAAARLLAGICREGRVPNYGANDGANILPLHGCEYDDFRPVIAAVLRAAGEPSPFPAGAWDELSEWFGLTPGPEAEAKPATSEEGGYFNVQSGPWLASIRCHSYQDRPSHADMLHVDVWHGNLNLLRDGGTYSYNDPDGIGDFLKSTAAHNAITVDGRDQMVKGTRFLWLDWTESKCLKHTPTGFIGEHYGYRTQEGVIHRREVNTDDAEVMIVDELYAVDKHTYRMNFRLGGSDWKMSGKTVENPQFQITFEGPPKLAIELLSPEDETSLVNAESTRYGRLDRCFAILLEWPGESCRIKTTIRSR